MKKKGLPGMILALAMVMLAGCQGSGPAELSNDYVTVKDFQGVEIEKVKPKETTQENVDSIIGFMMDDYIKKYNLPEDTQITDEIVKELSDKSETVEEYRKELYNQIKATKEEAALEEEKTRIWEKVMDHTEVKKYPEERLKEVKQDLVDLYDTYAGQSGKTYEEYLKAADITDADLDEAAEASLKQELAADVIAQRFGLKPTDKEIEEEAGEYAEEYKFSSVELMYQAISKEDVRNMLTQDKVKDWLHDRCKYVNGKDE